MKDFSELYDDHKIIFWLFVLLGIPLILVAGSLLLRSIFWDGFLWRYIWGPVVADTRGEPINGISSGYNVVNTTVYAVSLLLAVLGILEIFKRYRIRMDRGLILSLLPWILLGGTFRSLEDAGFFSPSLSPFFISPVIYFVLGIGAILTLILDVKFSTVENNKGVLRALFLTPPLIVSILLNPPYLAYVIILLLAVLVFFYLYGYFKEEPHLLFCYGTSMLSFTLFYISYYLLTLEGARPFEIFFILFLSATSSGLVFFVGWLLSSRFTALKTLLISLNPQIIFAHMLDASATYRGISAYGYVEKHVLPSIAIDLFGTSFVMYPMKMILVLFVIYTLDIWFDEELKEVPSVKNLIILVIIILGLAPGIRNMLRLAMGV
ncbi:MAG: DUF63 family protein [Thermoplasmata archaeon]